MSYKKYFNILNKKSKFFFIANFLQLDAIFVSHLELPFIRPILNVFGPNLTSLILIFTEDSRNKLDMAWLGGSCTQLKNLSLISLQHPPILHSEHDPVGWSPDTFLPFLTQFRTNICLGKWAPLFEGKSTLTHLHLYCCHVGSRVIACILNDLKKSNSDNLFTFRFTHFR